MFVDEPAIARARSVWRRPPVRPPGEAFEYLNTNYLILGNGGLGDRAEAERSHGDPKLSRGEAE